MLPAAVFTTSSCKNRKEPVIFSFAFLTDIHLAPERNAVNGFRLAADKVNEMKPDFVITGGDLIMDALGQRFSRADSLYNMYIEEMKMFRMPVYNTLGNHEIYGIYKRSGADSLHPEYGEKMFEKRLGPSYYSFSHKGWKFFILNSVEDTGRDRYIGKIDDAQLNWIRDELQKTDTLTPLVISTHIPFLTANTQKYVGSTVASDSGTVVVNSKETLDRFKRHNLRLVLQGHLHTIEDILIDDIRFVTCGAVSGGWWRGPNMGFEEGFMMVSLGKNSAECKYIDYGWNVTK